MLLDAVEDAIMVMGKDLQLMYVNASARTFLGIGEVPGGAGLLDPFDLLHPEDRDQAFRALSTIFDTPGARADAAFRVMHRNAPDGWRLVQAHAENRFDVPGIEGVVICFRNLEREAALAEASSRLEHALEHTTDLLMLHSHDGRLHYANAPARRFFSLDASSKAPWLYPHELRALLVDIGVPEAMARGTWTGDASLGDEDGAMRTFELVVSTRDDDDVVITARDVTAVRLAEIELLHRAHHDQLTGLANRAALKSALDALTSPVPDERVAVLFLDLDRFKLVNDSIGHQFGDELLIAVADRLRTVARPLDLLARLGGDEFVMVLRDPCGSRPMSEVADRVAKRIHQLFARPVRLGERDIYVSTSIGYAPQNGSLTSSELLRRADLAMFQAKTAGRAQTAAFKDAFAETAERGLLIETELHRALEHDEFRVAYQPIVSSQTERIVGFEALVRWHCGREIRQPGRFLTIAEESVLITRIDTLVLHRACSQLVEWTASIPDAADVTMSVNMSARQIARPDLVDVVATVLDNTGLEPHRLMLEITEGNLMTDLRATSAALDGLRSLGVKLAIDDFGIGYSSLSYLQQFHAHTLKIDRSFVSQSDDRPHDGRIVEAIVALAETFEMTTVAEGIESRAQLDRMKQVGCTMLQGFLLGRGLSAEGATALLQSSTKRPKTSTAGSRRLTSVRARAG